MLTAATLRVKTQSYAMFRKYHRGHDPAVHELVTAGRWRGIRIHRCTMYLSVGSDHEYIRTK
jgi:hypothetical protein